MQGCNTLECPGMGYWGKYDEDDRQALVVHAVYKSRMTPVDATLKAK